VPIFSVLFYCATKLHRFGNDYVAANKDNNYFNHWTQSYCKFNCTKKTTTRRQQFSAREWRQGCDRIDELAGFLDP
jgi:hypothetical protein